MQIRNRILVITTENRLSHPSQKFFLNKNPYITAVPEPVEGPYKKNVIASRRRGNPVCRLLRFARNDVYVNNYFVNNNVLASRFTLPSPFLRTVSESELPLAARCATVANESSFAASRVSLRVAASFV